MDRCRGSVLVLHPDRHERATLAALLLERGFSVATASAPEQAHERMVWPGVPDVLVVGGPLRMEPMHGFLTSLPMLPGLSEVLVVLATGELPPPAITHLLLGSVPTPRTRERLVELVAAGCRRRRRGRSLWEPIGTGGLSAAPAAE